MFLLAKCLNTHLAFITRFIRRKIVTRDKNLSQIQIATRTINNVEKPSDVKKKQRLNRKCKN